MKKYPYTESTDLIIYDQKPKKEKKQKVWLTAVCSALAASIFTAGVFGTGMYFMQKNMNNNTQSAAVASETTQSDDSSSSDSAQLAAYKNGKKVLTIPEIAEQVGPSVVGVINKTTVQPQNITIRSAEDIIIQAATEAQTVKPLNKAAVRELFSKTTVTS